MAGAAVRAGLTHLPPGEDGAEACVRQADRALELARRLFGPGPGTPWRFAC